MAIQSDENGFLVGESIANIKRINKDTTALLKEVRDIKRLLGLSNNDTQPRPANPPTPPSNNSGSNSNTGGSESQARARRNRTRNSGNQSSGDTGSSEQTNHNGNTGNGSGQSQSSGSQSNSGNSGASGASGASGTPPSANTGNNSQPPSPPSNQPTPPDIAPSPPSNQPTPPDIAPTQDDIDSTPPTPRVRDSNGRRGRNSRGQFTGGNGLDKDTKDGGNAIKGMFDGLGDRITTALNIDGLEEVDPTIKAFQETVEPLARGYQFLFGGGDKQDKPYFAWFKKIWTTLKKTEKNTSENTAEDGGTSIMGMLTTFAVAGLVAWSSFSKDGKEFWEGLNEKFISPIISSIGDWLKESSGYNKAVDWTSQNIIDPVAPVIDSIVQGWSAIFTNMGTVWDLAVASFGAAWNIATTTILEVFKVAALVFSALWTPIADFFSTNIFPIISAGWDKVTSIGAAAFDYVAKSFDTAIDLVKSIFTGIADNWNKIAGFVGDVFTSFSNFMKDKFGIDIPAAVSIVTETVSDAGKSVADQASAAKQALSDKISSIAQPVLDQAAIAKQNITDTVDKEAKSVSEAADKNSKATEKTASAMEDYLKKLSNLGGKIGGGLMDSVIGTANASETPYAGSIGGAGQAKGKGAKFAKGTEENQQMIIEESIKAGVDPKMMLALAAIESGGNAKAHNKSGASGLFQFMPMNFESYGLKGGKVYDPVLNTRAAIKMVKSNAKHLEKNGIEANTGNIYLAHQQGAAGAVSLLNGGSVGKQAAAQNGGVNGKALADLWTGKANATYQEIAYSGNVRNDKPTITPEQIAAAAPKSVATMPVTNTVSNIAPATLSMPKAPKIIETTKNIMPIMGGDNRSGNAMPMMVSEIGQDLPDRTLAHIVTGGVGGI